MAFIVLALSAITAYFISICNMTHIRPANNDYYLYKSVMGQNLRFFVLFFFPFSLRFNFDLFSFERAAATANADRYQYTRMDIIGYCAVHMLSIYKYIYKINVRPSEYFGFD